MKEPKYHSLLGFTSLHKLCGPFLHFGKTSLTGVYWNFCFHGEARNSTGRLSYTKEASLELMKNYPPV